MASMFDPIKAVLTPDMFASVGARLGVPAEMVQKGTEIAIPLLTRGVAGVAETPEGQVAIADAIKNADTSLIGNLSGFLGSFEAGSGSDVLTRLFGPESRVVTSTIKDATGFDITPIAAMAGPLLLGMLNSTAQKEGLDTNGIVKLLTKEARSFDRQKNESAVLVDEVLGKVDEVRKLKGTFSPGDWATVSNAPLAAATLVIAASPSSDKKTVQEMEAAIASIDESAAGASATSLIAALYHNGTDKLTAEGITDAMASVKSAADLVKQRAPAEYATYSKILLNAAYAAAEAVKEGGFLGMGGRKVTEAEQGVIDRLSGVLGV